MTNNQTQFINWIKKFSPETYQDVIAEIGAITDTAEGYKAFLHSVIRNGPKYFGKEDLNFFNINIDLASRNLAPNTYLRKQRNTIIKQPTPLYPPPKYYPPPTEFIQPVIPPRNGGPAIVTGKPSLGPIAIVSTKERNQQKFLEWVKSYSPALYAAAIARAGTLTGWFDWFGDFTGALVDLAPAYLGFKGQKEMLDIQMDRAREGQPPLPQEIYQPGYTPPVGTRPPPVTTVTRPTTGINWQQMMPWLLGGGVLLGFMMMRR